MTEILVVKTAALGDVLRTTSILPGLARAHAGCRVTWITAPGAVDLVRTHPLVNEVVALDARDEAAVDDVIQRLATREFSRTIALDDEPPLCRLATRVPTARLSGAYLRSDGTRAYTQDVAPWFDMGLLSVHGKRRADELKVLNTRSHPRIYADMLGIEMGRPELHLTPEAARFGRRFAAEHALDSGAFVVGLNTGAGGRWVSKQLSVDRTVELACIVAARLERNVRFVVLGGEPEAERSRRIVEGCVAAGVGDLVVDAGTRNPLLEFAAIVDLCRLIVTSDSLALHIAIARGVRCVAFFAPTSAAEIELYGLGEKVVSTAPDYCSYAPDADNSTITPERLAEAVVRLARAPWTRSPSAS